MGNPFDDCFAYQHVPGAQHAFGETTAISIGGNLVEGCIVDRSTRRQARGDSIAVEHETMTIYIPTASVPSPSDQFQDQGSTHVIIDSEDWWIGEIFERAAGGLHKVLLRSKNVRG